jgi:hypothetical protein
VIRSVRKFAAVSLACLAAMTATLPAAQPVIGVAVSQGRMEIERAPVDGSGNLTDGSMLRSAASPARIRLANGHSATLAAHSRARVFAGRIVLEQGQVLATSAGYRTEAMGFQAVPSGSQPQTLLALLEKQVQVSAVRGFATVTDGQGVTIARVPAGRALSLEPSTAATEGQADFTGLLRRERSGFVLKDDVTNLDVELRGAGLERHAGSRVHATGKAEISKDGKSQVVLVSRLMGAQDAPPQDRPAGGNRPDTEPRRTGMSNGAKVAIIAAVAGGAAVGVVAATGGKSDSVSR